MKAEFNKLSGVIVGLGSIGNRHLNNCLELGVGQMSVVRRPNSNSQFSPPDEVSVVHSIAEALQSKPDFAIVCNPSHLHASTAIEFLDGNCHVLIEKPLGKTIGPDEQKLIEVSAQSDRIVAMAYCMRFHPVYARAKELVQSGAIGRCLYAKAWFEGFLPDWHPWEDYKQSYAALPEQGGGVLRTLDHEMDFLNWVLGPAESVSGEAFNSQGIGIEADDVAMYQMKHPAGVHSQVTTAFCRKPQSRGFEFVGTEGSLSFRHEDGDLWLSTHPESLLTATSENIAEMYIDLGRDFLKCTAGTSKSSLPLLEDGVQNMVLIDAVIGPNLE